jgi:hypothetical protein
MMEVEAMSLAVPKEEAKKFIGQEIYAVKKDGSVVTGKLIRIKGTELIFASKKGKVRTKAIIPLVLFDLLAIGATDFGGFGYGGGYGGYGGYDGYGGAFGYGPGYGSDFF